MVEYEAIKNHVTLWDVAVERQIMVKGRDAEAFVDYVITRDATKISPMRARYVILCNPQGGVLNDPVLLRVSKDEFWFSLADSDVGIYLQGVNHDKRFDVVIDEIDVLAVKIGTKAEVTTDALPGQTLIGRVSFISVEPQSQQGVVVYPVKIEVSIATTEVKFKEGLSSTARIIVNEEKNVLTIPE